MCINVYQFINEIVDGECDIWIRGDSNTGKTTFLKYLFDCDRSHNYKWMLGGCRPSSSGLYYQHLMEDILKTTYISNATMTIYVDEVLNHHVKKLIELKDILGFPIRFIIVSHHLPPDDLKESFTIFQMTEILPIRLLREYISKNCNFNIPTEIEFSISDCFFIIDHIDEINSFNDLMKLYEENFPVIQQKRKIKTTVDHNIWILQTHGYERINVLKIKETKYESHSVNQ